MTTYELPEVGEARSQGDAVEIDGRLYGKNADFDALIANQAHALARSLKAKETLQAEVLNERVEKACEMVFNAVYKTTGWPEQVLVIDRWRSGMRQLLEAIERDQL